MINILFTDLPDHDDVLACERTHPDHWEIICEDPGMQPNAVQEWADEVYPGEFEVQVDDQFAGCLMVTLKDE